MSWSLTIARVAGSEIRIHITFLLLLAWIGIATALSGGAAAAMEAVVFVIAIFACVVLHELGHAIAARRYGITTPDITLLPIGGLARLSRLPEKPGEEIVIALAGPAVNVVIALVVMLFLGTQIDPAALQDIDSVEPGFWMRLAAVNVFLVVFNLIPAFPMDGGRVLRAVLAIRFGRSRATEVAARVGQALAFGFGFLGLFAGNPILVFIAIFVYLAASAEAGQSSLMEITRRLRVRDAMITTYESLDVNATIGEAGEALLRTTQHEFPVVDGGGRLRGVVTRDMIVHATKDPGPEVAVIDVMEREIPEVGAGRRLDAALRHLQEKNAPIVAVVDDDGRFVGYVSQDNITELWMLDEAGAHVRGPWGGGNTGGR